jgi:hypothetical protein
MAMMQEQARQRALLEADIAARIAEHTHINETLIKDIEDRISGDANLTYGIGNETAARNASDILIQTKIDNATTYLIQIQAFDAQSMIYFMTLMQNVTDITSGIFNETVARTDKDALLVAQDVIFDNALVLLVNLLTQETYNRTTTDDMIRMQLQLLGGAGVVYSVDGQLPDGGDIQIVSTNAARLTITNPPSTNQVVLTDNCLLSFNNTLGNGVHNFVFIANNGLVLTTPAPHTIQISSPYAGGIPTNIYHLSTVYPFGSESCYYQGCYSTDPVCNFAGDMNNNGVKLRDVVAGHCINPFTDCAPGWACDASPTGNWCTKTCTVGGTECQTYYGNQWACVAFPVFPTVSGQGLCQHTLGCSLGPSANTNRDETQCAFTSTLGAAQWQCQNNHCRQLFCFYDYDCSNGKNDVRYTCFNGRCVFGSFTGTVSGLNGGAYDINGGRTPGTLVSTYQFAGDSFHCPCDILNGNCPQRSTRGLAEPVIYSNAEPYVGYGLPCGFPTFDGQTCGFRIPAGQDSSWMIHVVINLRVSWNDNAAYGDHFWRLHINRGNGWEDIKGSATSHGRFVGFDEFPQTYVSLSTTVFMTSVSNFPYAQGQRLFIGWSCISGTIPSGNINHVPGVYWAEMNYDVTRVF